MIGKNFLYYCGQPVNIDSILSKFSKQSCYCDILRNMIMITVSLGGDIPSYLHAIYVMWSAQNNLFFLWDIWAGW